MRYNRNYMAVCITENSVITFATKDYAEALEVIRQWKKIDRHGTRVSYEIIKLGRNGYQDINPK